MNNLFILNNAKNIINGRFARVEMGTSVFDKRFSLCVKLAKNDIQSLISDVYACERLSFISIEDADMLTDAIKRLLVDKQREYADAYKSIIGEEEYDIQWVMNNINMSREDAIIYIAEFED